MLKITQTKQTVTQEYQGVPLTIARSNSPEFLEKFRRIAKPHQRAMDKRTLPAEKSLEITCEAMAGTVLVGWDEKALGEVTGDLCPFTEANAKELLINDPDCREFVSSVAGDLDQFLAEQTEVTAKK